MIAETISSTVAQSRRGGARRGAGRPPIFVKAMTPTERVRRSRAMAKERQGQPLPGGPGNGPTAAESHDRVLQALDGIRVLLEVQGGSLAALQQQRRDQGEIPVQILRRLTELERLVRGDPGLAAPPKHTRRRPLGI
jgi:hypothetical protein